MVAYINSTCKDDGDFWAIDPVVNSPDGGDRGEIISEITCSSKDTWKLWETPMRDLEISYWQSKHFTLT